VPTDPGLTILAYTATPGSDAARALHLLGDWNQGEHTPPGGDTGAADMKQQDHPEISRRDG
jgi:hypothetical protein